MFFSYGERPSCTLIQSERYKYSRKHIESMTISDLQVTNLRWWRWRLWLPRFWGVTDCPPCQDERMWDWLTASHCVPAVASGFASPRGSRQPVIEPTDPARQVLNYFGRCWISVHVQSILWNTALVIHGDLDLRCLHNVHQYVDLPLIAYRQTTGHESGLWRHWGMSCLLLQNIFVDFHFSNPLQYVGFEGVTAVAMRISISGI
jgi:hypothetical protein